MVREEAIASERMWAGLVRTQPRMLSGWHHHGEYETTIYITAGAFRMESGPGGTEIVEAGAGDFLYVPPGVVHRESNPSDEESRLVVVRSGSGPTVIDADGPA